MGFFRFRRRIKILPGLWLNASKSGLSTSIGGKGVTVNLRKGKVKTTYSIPGTGLSYISTTRAANDPHHQVTSGEHEPDHQAAPEYPAASKSKVPVYIFLLLLVLLIFLMVK